MIIPRQKSFSSKQQKALRKAYDLRRGWGLKEGVAPSRTEIKTQLELAKNKSFQKAISSDLKKGRALNDRTADIGKTVDSSINSKAVNHADFGHSGNASEIRLRPKKYQESKKYLKEVDRKGYDHGPKSNIQWNKEEMELRK